MYLCWSSLVSSYYESFNMKHIHIFEMYAVLAATDTWANRWVTWTIVFITDSSIVQAALMSGKSKSEDIMDLLRWLFWLSVQWNFVYKAVHISKYKC